jgi:hypothetical protein
MRAFVAVPIAIAVCLAVPAFADSGSHVTAAKKAERKGDWRKALHEWKAAYAAEPNAEYLIGVGDAYAHLGNKAEAKKSYEGYLSDPLALPANVEKVKAKIAQLQPPVGGALALPAPALPLPSAAPPATALPLPSAAPAAPADKKTAAAALPLPGLDLPAKTAMPPLPGLSLPGATSAAKKEPDKVASASVPPLPLPGLPVKTEPASPKKDAAPAVAKDSGKTPAQPIALVTAPAASDKAPVAALTTTALPRDSQRGSSGGVQRTMAYVTAAVAIVALSGGALAFSQANSVQSELNGKVHSGAEAQQLLGDAQRNQTLSMVGFAGGLVAAGISTALFVF